MKIQDSIEHLINELYRVFDISTHTVFDLNQFLDHLNIHVKEDENLNYKGYIESSNNQITITIKETNNDALKRFNLAHQLGHYFLHFKDDNHIFKDSAFHRDINYNDEEYEANLFASYLLMPTKNFVKCAMNEAYDTSANTFNIEKISHYFHVSTHDIIQRGKFLKLFK